jgi:DNA-binding IclR family transcriptional regulator
MDSEKASSAEKVLDILLKFGDAHTHLSTRSISKICGGSRSTTYRYLQMLRARGLIEEARHPGQYRLGPAITRLARVTDQERRFTDRVRPIMEALARDCGESIMLSRRAGLRMVVLTSVDSDKMLRVNMEAADNLPIHRGSFGKLYLAFQADELAKLSKSQRSALGSAGDDIAALKSELALIRKQGYATSRGEVEAGAASISAPILTSRGAMFAALTIAGPAARLTGRAIRKLVPKIAEAAREIAVLCHREGFSPQLARSGKRPRERDTRTESAR